MSAQPQPLISDIVAPDPLPAVSLTRKLFGSVSALMVSTSLERGLTFLAHLAAARVGGAAIFGGYSLALTTANNIASYAGAGIGATATRFSGAYAHDETSRRTLSRALILVSLTSALAAALLLVCGAGLLAKFLLHKQELAGLLRWAALPAAGAILLECCRGYLVGQRDFKTQVRLAAMVGFGLLLVLPAAAKWGAIPMVCGFAVVGIVALLVVLTTAKRIPRPVPVLNEAPAPTISHLVREVWRFGAVQLLGVIGLNAAGLWIASLLVRFDSSMVQLGLFAAANQVRNIAGLAPGLFTQSSFGLLADRRHDATEVLGVSTVSAAIAVVLLSGLGIAILPFALPLLYGPSFRGAVLPGSLALATAIVHLSNGPAAARLNIVALRLTGGINAIWSAIVFALGIGIFFWQPLRIRPALAATSIYLVAHICSAALVFFTLRRRREMPSGIAPVIGLATASAILLAFLALARSIVTGFFQEAGWTTAIVFLTLLSAILIFEAGRKEGWAPRPPAALARTLRMGWMLT